MRRLVALVVAIAVVGGVPGIGFAADSNSLTVSANVVGTCRFNSGTSTLAFGALDPSSGANAVATGTTTFWCTRGAAYSIANDGGLNNSGGPRMQHATDPTQFIPYSLTMSPTNGTGSGPSTPVTLTLDGTISFADYSNALAGTYSDTVVITVTP